MTMCRLVLCVIPVRLYVRLKWIWAEQIYLWRQDLDKLGKADRMKKVMSGGMEFMMNRPSIFNMALKWAPLVNGVPRFLIYTGLNDWGKGREMPKFAKESFNEMWKKGKVK